ncbi:hypothetical protein [Luteolibacter sp. Populi]|uniref:hypothetical protein n=1 Tax=Luteolibacter sp. Populi TaxID=3230487 RepID=UPI003466009F
MPLPFLRPKDSFITCRDRDDGGGAQISARISTMILARLKGLTYAHTPVSDVAHRPDGVSSEDWSATWENFFNLGAGEIQAADLAGYPLRPVAKPHRFWPRSRSLHVVAHCHRLTNHRPEAWAAIAPALRAKYHLSAKPESPGYDDGRLQVAVHLRRGDVAVTGQFAQWFTPDEVILERLKRVIGMAGKDRVNVRLFSEGKPEDFRAFTELGATLHLDEDVFETFHHLVKSDVLIMAKSTFSYLGAIIGGQVCLYEPFWHPKLPGWLGPEEWEGWDRKLNARRMAGS